MHAANNVPSRKLPIDDPDSTKVPKHDKEIEGGKKGGGQVVAQLNLKKRAGLRRQRSLGAENVTRS